MTPSLVESYCLFVCLLMVCPDGAGWQLCAGDLPLPGEHKASGAESLDYRRATRHRACVCNSAHKAQDMPGATVHDQATVDACADVPL